MAKDFTIKDGEQIRTRRCTIASATVIEAGDLVTLDAGGLNTQSPKIAHSSGVMTATFDDTQGYSGKFQVVGK